jgi:hypothetical protein
MLFGLAAVSVAFVAGRFTAPEVTTKPLVIAKTQKVIETVAVHCPPERVIEIEDEPYEDPGAIEAEDTAAVRMLENESKRIATLESQLGLQGALRGQVRDAKDGEHLPGVTVIATLGSDNFTAITDENGWYEISLIPEGTYTVRFYYLESTVEHAGVAVAGRKVTPLFGKVESRPLETIVIAPHGHGITIDHDYVKNIPIPGRTFEGVLGAAGDSQHEGITIDEAYVENIAVPAEGFTDSPDPCAPNIGVTFNGSEATENEY